MPQSSNPFDQFDKPKAAANPFDQFDQKAAAPAQPVPDYDYEGFKASGKAQAANGHYPDTFKLPNHMTFSSESKYSKPGQEGGKWSQVDDKWHYAPSEWNLKQHSAEDMQAYFKKTEPDSVLDLPKNPFDQFDKPAAAGNPFDQFDKPSNNEQDTLAAGARGMIRGIIPAAAGLYAVLHSLGLLNSDLDDFCKDNSKIYGHINHLASSHISLSTGSLGHGLPFGVGIALANKLKKSNSKVFVVISDGELNEGTTWESALFAGHHSLSNLVVVIDRNRIQSLGFTEDTLKLDPIDEKWQSFGWNTVEIDGHNYGEILDAAILETTKPLCVVANTIKGKGVTYMENTTSKMI